MTTTTGRARWILITPTTTRDEWFEAIQTGAEVAGKFAVATWAAPLDHGRLAEDLVFVTDLATSAGDNGADEIVVLMPDPEFADIAMVSETAADLSASALPASRRLAEAADLATCHRIIGADQIPSPGAPLELFPGLTIETPGSPLPHVPASGRAAAAVFRDFYAKGAPRQVTSNWPLELLTHHQKSLIDGRLGEFDLTGRPRFLVTGPYLWMPAGTWKARVRFALDEDAARRRFRLDWGGVEVWTEQHFKADHSGQYEMELTHTFERAQPSEVRLIITEGCFSGRVDFLGVTIEHVSPAS